MADDAGHPVPYRTAIPGAPRNFRTGPGTSYTSKGLVGKADKKFYQYCERGNWAYGKVLKGAHKGKKGWIHENYIGWPMNPPGEIPSDLPG